MLHIIFFKIERMSQQLTAQSLNEVTNAYLKDYFRMSQDLGVEGFCWEFGWAQQLNGGKVVEVTSFC